MLIDCFTLDAGEIITRKFIDTDRLEPSDLEYYQEFLQRLQLGEDSISVSGDPPHDVRLRLGLPSPDCFHQAIIDEKEKTGQSGELSDDEEWKELVDDYEMLSAEARSQIFALYYEESGVMYLIIPSHQEEPSQELVGLIAATYARSLIKGRSSRLPDEKVMADVKGKANAFHDIAHEIWEARPAIVISHSWDAEWDEFAENIGTAMLLHLESTHD